MEEDIVQTRKAELDKLFKSDRLFATVGSTESAPKIEPIWGNWILKKTVILQVGEPGISKTTLNYSLAGALVNAKPFLNINGHIHRQVRILYLDLESSDSLIKSRKNVVGCGDNPNFLKCNVPNVTLGELEPYIDKLVKRYGYIDIMFVDPIRSAFNTRDENDNSEASRQMKYVRYLVQKWNTAMVLVHHSSKAELSGTRKGSGAWARAALADVCWNFEKLGEGFSDELFKLYIPKNRYVQDGLCICIEKEEGKFNIVDFPAGYVIQSSGIRIYSAQQAIDLIMQDQKERMPQEIATELTSLKIDISRQGLHKALISLMQLGVLEKTAYGFYKYVP